MIGTLTNYDGMVKLTVTDSNGHLQQWHTFETHKQAETQALDLSYWVSLKIIDKTIRKI
jgi:hypothetical protein